MKFNTSKYSYGLEFLTEFFSINHKRELRVYEWYQEKKHQFLLIPKLYESNKRFIKIEKLVEDKNSEKSVDKLFPNIREFLALGEGRRQNFFDIMSSPTQSILRGLITNAKFLGIKTIFQAIKHLYKFYKRKPKSGKNYLIHKDLKSNQNLIHTKKGTYFIDFGSSVLTKNFFLTDIVELANDDSSLTVDMNMIESFVGSFDSQVYDVEHLQSQIYLLLFRRYIHLHPTERKNPKRMKNVKSFIESLDCLVRKFSIAEKSV